jgi:hypothetical protein
MGWLDFLPDISLPDHVDIDIINVGPEVEGDFVGGDAVDGDQIDVDYAIKSEGNIVPINEIDRVVQGKLSGEAPLELREEKSELVIDPENLEGEDEWEEVVKPGLKAGWREERAVSTKRAYPILLQAERNITDEKINDIKEFFDGKIFSSDYLLLQSSLTLDRAMNADDGTGMTNDELKRRKRNLAEKYHDAAFSLPSMCTSGYFDDGELFRQVYEEMDESTEHSVSNYDSVFRKMITHKPFVAYAKDSQSASELTDIVRGKIARLPNYDIPLPFIDVRGIGRSNHQKIRAAMESIEEECEKIEYDERVGDEELIVRIDAASIT